MKHAPRKCKLTELFLAKLKPEAAAFLVWDAHQHGLAISVQPTGSRAWKCIYSHHGRPRWLHLGDARAIGLADARLLAAEAMLAVARGKAPPLSARPNVARAPLPSWPKPTSSDMPSARTRVGNSRTRW